MTDTIYLIMGESGAGKDTVVDRLVEQHGLRRLCSYTTRPSRGIGDKHIFVDDFLAWRNANPDDTIVGYTEFDGHYYWATASQVEESDFYIIDPDGVRFFRNAYFGSKRVKVIYFNMPGYKRIDHMVKRGDGLWNAAKRFLHDNKKFIDAMRMADYVVNDGTIDEMAADLFAYMNKN